MNVIKKNIFTDAEQVINKPEIWAGIECTVNRLNDRYIDQVDLTNHSSRTRDLELFASLGIKKIRYPVLWERTCNKNNSKYNWEWSDERLEKLRRLNITPIVGLLHHGSGPAFTNLVDENMPELFSEYALAVALRYPWLEYYNPINEPLTTARFSCLYGHWYPHLKDNLAFSKAILLQCKAIILALKKIRSVNPDAKLIQTEDLGKVHSTKKLKYQADFENERRWLTYDLLTGRVNKDHVMWKFFIEAGIKEKEILFFLDNSLPPDMLGINYYITSERFLDHRIERFPLINPGGNAFHTYVDVEAVRVGAISGIKKLFKEAWERYKIPLAVTEVHMACTREEQLRWFKEIYESTVELNSKKVPVKAVTAWSLLGSFDWNSLITKPEKVYESGIFDLRSNSPRTTALSSLIKSLTGGAKFNHPVLQQAGWWKRTDRFINNKFQLNTNSGTQPLLITGKTGTLGAAFANICSRRGIDYRILSRSEMDIADYNSVQEAINKFKPWGLINTAGYVNVDKAETEIEFCIRENTTGATVLADACNKYGIKLLTFSTDLVFNGEIKNPYTESIPVCPINVYGQSKAEAEKYIMKYCSSALIIRTSAFFGPWDGYNFLTQSLNKIAQGISVLAADDIIISPTYVPDLVNACLDLFIDDEKGIWHLTNYSAVTWYDFLTTAADIVNAGSKLIKGIPSGEMKYIAQRPSYSALGSERGVILPGLENAMERFSTQLKATLKF